MQFDMPDGFADEDPADLEEIERLGGKGIFKKTVKQDREGAPKPPQRPAAAQNPQPAQGQGRMPFAAPVANPGFLTPRQQANHLQDMAKDVMRTYQDENDSRVAQARELLRMEHEKEMEDKANAADLQKEAMRKDALLARLGGQGAFRVYDPSIHGFRYVDEVRFGG